MLLPTQEEIQQYISIPGQGIRLYQERTGMKFHFAAQAFLFIGLYHRTQRAKA